MSTSSLLNADALASSAHSDPRLAAIEAKLERGERLTLDDGFVLFTTPDLWAVCRLADRARRRLNGNITWYNVNRHVNYSNICALSCSFCAFHRKKGQDGAYEFSVEQVAEEARKAQDAGATELHIVGGLHPWLPFSYYTDMLQAVRARAPKIHIKAFTAVEIVHLAKISKRPNDIRGVLADLKAAGLGSLPGGGAEVFDDRVHDEAFKGKIRSDKWLEVHRQAHDLGLNSNATILYGHIETIEDRLHHFDLLRREQDLALAQWAADRGVRTGPAGEIVLIGGDETAYPMLSAADSAEAMGAGVAAAADETEAGVNGSASTSGGRGYRRPSPHCASGAAASRSPGPARRIRQPNADEHPGYFQTIVPLPFIPDNSDLQHLPGPSGVENLRMIAVSRLMLDNFPHVKAFWIMQTLEMAELMLLAGADDIDGTVVWYDITKVTDPTSTHQETDVPRLRRAIYEAGFVPRERDTLYREVRR